MPAWLSERTGNRDRDLAQLLLFEGRRIRGATLEVVLSKGFIECEKLLCLLINCGEAADEGAFYYSFASSTRRFLCEVIWAGESS